MWVWFRQRDINEDKVPWKDAVLRRAQDSADYNQSPAFCTSPETWELSCLAIPESSLKRVGEGLVLEVLQLRAAGTEEIWAGLGLILVILLDQDCERLCWEFVSSLVHLA